jgi:hypothetical protein
VEIDHFGKAKRVLSKTVSNMIFAYSVLVSNRPSSFIISR